MNLLLEIERKNPEVSKINLKLEESENNFSN